jgi:hypothetical protein
MMHNKKTTSPKAASSKQGMKPGMPFAMAAAPKKSAASAPKKSAGGYRGK